MLHLVGGCRWGQEGVNMCKQCLDSIQDGCSLLSEAGMLAGGGGAPWLGWDSSWIM